MCVYMCALVHVLFVGVQFGCVRSVDIGQGPRTVQELYGEEMDGGEGTEEDLEVLSTDEVESVDTYEEGDSR